jgi:organic radical activating enzyme
MTPDVAQIMAEKIRSIAPLKDLAKKEINLTGGEASQNPHIVGIYKVFKTLSGNVRLHTNLDINSEKSKRWERLVGITKLRGRIDITLYPTVWESRQKTAVGKRVISMRPLSFVIPTSRSHRFDFSELISKLV